MARTTFWIPVLLVATGALALAGDGAPPPSSPYPPEWMKRAQATEAALLDEIGAAIEPSSRIDADRIAAMLAGFSRRTTLLETQALVKVASFEERSGWFGGLKARFGEPIDAAAMAGAEEDLKPYRSLLERARGTPDFYEALSRLVSAQETFYDRRRLEARSAAEKVGLDDLLRRLPAKADAGK